MDLEKKILQHIREGMKKLTRTPEQMPANTKIKLPKPFSVPSDDQLSNFFYWDTYFINVVLGKLGDFKQMKNNLDNQKYLIEKLGFVPNADHLIDRSQPPLYVSGVYDYFVLTGDKESLEGYVDAGLVEHKFWSEQRMSPCGLNVGGCTTPDEELVPFCLYVLDRLHIDPDTVPDKVELGRNLMSMAESGWDFSPRFETDYSLFAACDFAPIDLNSILYESEVKLAALCSVLNREADRERMQACADKRRELMDKYMKDGDGIYLDYNFKTGRRSKIVNAASMYPYAFGMSEDREAALKVLNLLERDCGVAVCMDSGNKIVMQWDYPNMWGPVAWLVIQALDRLGLKDDAKRVCRKFVSNIETVFSNTGELWEKYNCLEESIEHVKAEYGTPAMLGFTAAGYMLAKDYLKNFD